MPRENRRVRFFVRSIGAYEAKTERPALLRRIAAGECFVIAQRRVPVAELGPIASGTDPVERSTLDRALAQAARGAGLPGPA